MTAGINNSVQSAFANGVSGYQDAVSQARQAASHLAQGHRNDINVNSAAMALQQSSLQAQASAEVIERSDGMLGSIIDIYV